MSYRTSTPERIVTASVLGLAAVWAAREALRLSRKIDLAHRTVLITGGSRGLGLALARELARQNARIAICARNQEELAAAENDLIERGADVKAFTCDLQDSEQIAPLIEEVESSCGPIDVLVNNAGTILVGPAEVMNVDDYHEAMAVNFWAAVHATLALLPKMKARGFGRIVNIASVGGKMPVPHLAPYCASKFALVGFSGAMRAELAKDGILVTTVNPGLMRTGSPRNAIFKGKHRAEYAWFSISDDLPGVSMSAARAARRIVKAAIHGDAEVTLSLPAKLVSKSYGLFPNLHLEATALADRALPTADDADKSRKRGYESESPVTRSFLRYFGRRAEQDYNQLKT